MAISLTDLTKSDVSPGKKIYASDIEDRIDAINANNTILEESCVDLASTQNNISGQKTFTANPIVPTPTSDTHAATKGYVDGMGFVAYSGRLATGMKEYGTASSTSSGKLVDSTATFITANIAAGDWVYNKTDATVAQVVSVDSETQLTLDTNIMASGEIYSVGTLKINSELVTLDLSSFIPAGAKAVIMKCYALAAVYGKSIHLYDYNALSSVGTVETYVAGIGTTKQMICPLNSNRQIKYYIHTQTAGSAGWSEIYINAVGYFM